MLRRGIPCRRPPAEAIPRPPLRPPARPPPSARLSHAAWPLPSAPPRRPTPAEIRAAVDKTVPDVIAPGLDVLFCGINPGLYTAAVGHHFARPGNRFWPALHAAGFTDRLLAPHEERPLLDLGYGITNVVARPPPAPDELPPEELAPAAARLARKVARCRPRWLAVRGDRRVPGAVRQAARGARAAGRRRLGATRLWVLPNPSGLNAHYQAGSWRGCSGSCARRWAEGEPRRDTTRGA